MRKKICLELCLLAAAGLLAMAGCATVPGTITPQSAAPEESWIAPKVPESSKRALVVPVTLQAASGATLNGYRLTVMGQDNRAVRTIEVKAAAPQRTFLGLGGWKVPSVPEPTEITWDGKNDAGEYVADGTYTYVVEAWGGPGVDARTQPKIVHVDNSYPSVTLSVDDPYFSPGTGEGRQKVTIDQRDATVSPQWNGELRDTKGQVVRTFTWSGSPKDLVWDGTDGQGKLLPDGQYTYRVSTVNLAGTPRSIALAVALVIDTRPKEATVKVQYDAFSPAGPSPRKTLTLSPVVSAASEVISWKLAIDDSARRAVRTYRGTTAPGPVAFDGRDDGGRYLPDGTYDAVLDVTYRTRADARATSAPFRVLSTPPRAEMAAPYLVFAPGEGARPALVVDVNADKDARWSAAIYDSGGSSVFSTTWDSIPNEWQWDGRDSAGRPLPDGGYRLVLTGVDPAQNAATFALPGIRIDTRPGRATLSAPDAYFSPNGDGVKDALTLTLGGDNLDSVAAWSITISDRQGAGVRHITANGPWTGSGYAWDGRGDDHRVLPDGTYNANLAIEYVNGLTAVSQPVRTVLDATPPKLSVDLSPQLFSPDETSEDKTLSIAIGYEGLAPAVSWSFKIDDPTGVDFFDFSGEGVPARPLKWDGRSASGELVQSAADYPYLLTVRDAAGNTGTSAGKIPIDILVLREGDKLRIDVPFINFEGWSAKLITPQQDPVLAAQTQRAFDLLIPKLEKYPQHRIRIEGHAVRIYWFNDRLGQIEERDVLGPLSKARAETVRDVLISRGIAPDRLSVAGLGGTDPIVPFSDLVNRWKDRRVEFILVK